MLWFLSRLRFDFTTFQATAGPLLVMVPFKFTFGPAIGTRASLCTALGSMCLYELMFENGIRDGILRNLSVPNEEKSDVLKQKVTLLRCAGFGSLIPVASMGMGALTLPFVTFARKLSPQPPSPLRVGARQITFFSAWAYMHAAMLPIVMPLGAVFGAALCLPFRKLLASTLPPT